MARRLHRYYGAGYLHFITTSCYRRLPLLARPPNRDLFLRLLESVRRRYRFVVCGYVVTPEHVHLVIGEPERGDPSVLIKALKQGFARRLLARLRHRTNTNQLSLWEAAVERGRIFSHGSTTLLCSPIISGWRSCATCIVIRSSADWFWSRSSGAGAVSAIMLTMRRVR